MSVKWNCTFNNIEDRSYLEDLLPKNDHFSLIVNRFLLVEKSSIRYETKFEADILVNVCTKDQFEEFKQTFEGISGTSYNKGEGIHKDKGKILG